MAALVVAIVCGTMAAPQQQQQQERRKIKVGASFGGRPDSAGSSRALSQLEEPLIITEPLPGQEFVFISANPRQSQAAGGRAARVNPVAVAQLPSVRIENPGSGTILEDGILIAEHLGESNRAARLLDEPSGQPQPVFPVANADVQSWTPLSLPELLTGPAVVRELEPVSERKSSTQNEKEFRSLETAPAPVAETFSLEDAVTGVVVAESVKASDSVATVVVEDDTDRLGKAIDAQDDENIIAAESVSRRTVIKTAPNGQDYEYEYLYYDGTDVDESTNGTLSAPVEPNLFSNDQEIANALPASSVMAASDEAEKKKVAPPVELIPIIEDEQVGVTTESDLVEVQEIPHVAHVAFQVGDTGDIAVEQVGAIDSADDELVTEDFETTTATEATTTTTTTTTTPMPTTTTVASKRRRPTAQSTETPSIRPSLSRLTPLRRGNTPAVTEESPVTPSEPKRMRGKNRFSPESVPSSNAVPTESKADGAGSRRISRPRVRPSTSSSTLENRAGLAEIRFAELEGEIGAAADSVDVNDPSLSLAVDIQDDGFDFNRQSQPIEHFPINGRLPSHFQETDEFTDAQERTPLRVVESDSFRNSGNQGSAAGEPPISVGRLTVISGPARLPSPILSQFEDIAEQEEIISPSVAPVQDATESIQQLADEFESDIPAKEEVAAVEPEIFEIANHQEVGTETHHDDANKHKESPTFSLTHPSLTDLLAFSKAAEQQQQDDESFPTVEEVLIEEVVVATTTAVAPSSPPSTITVGSSQVQSLDDEFITQLAVDSEIPVIQKVNEEVADFMDEIVTTPEPAVLAVEPVQIIASPVLELSLDNDVEMPKTTDSTIEDVVQEDVATEDVTSTTTTTTTTTTAAPTTTTTPEPTTAAPTSSVRTPSRFGGSNANRFNNRIRNRVRGDADSSSGAGSTTTTTTTTAAPVKKNTFRPAGSPFNRLRRPTTPAVDSAKTASTSIDAIDAGSSAAEANESSSPASAVASTTRKPLPNNFRNRFQFRRNQTEVSKPAESSASGSTEPKVSLPAVSRPSRPTGQPSNRIVSPRPMSSVLKRGRFTSTTTTEAAPAVVAQVEESSTNETVSETEATNNEAPEKTEGEAGVEVVEPVVVTEATTTTTSRSAGLNRLRNRVSLPVSERPKTVRTQVSLTDRRNRFSGLSAKKSEADSSATAIEENNKEEPAEKAVSIASDVQEELEPIAANSAKASSSSPAMDGSVDSLNSDSGNVEGSVVTAAPAVSSLRNRRPNRIPGQLVARRT
ncbi:hypothetical protein DAPPUDRAFT_259942 [Daphnia pulex]|uniref:Uncharacterized protein n=1 Tax=Daphnia pulex TaxID=6669 RepID=E9HI62_DAPPU|nr:hypothetical protein DAPPUDRAFT_259942 [Daphnia pulex]|eukprot:EFX68568.1 hypothetical protein DAPPUDRAFT_259942 [Daphnia pulex]